MPSEGRWYEVVARVGLVASVVIGLLLAAVVAGLATNRYGPSADVNVQGAFRLLRERTFGTPLLVALGAACALHAVWRTAQATVAPGTARSSGWARAGHAGIAVLYAALAAVAWSTAMGGGGSGTTEGEQQAFTARVMGWPGGRLLVGAVGVGVVAAGAALVWWAASQRFRRDVDLRGLQGRTRTVGTTALSVGFAARGLVVAVVGAFVIHAAVQHDPKAGRGLDGALAELAAEPWGTAALWAVAAALAAWTVAAGLRVVAWDIDGNGRLGRTPT